MSKRKTWSRKKLNEVQKWADAHGAERTDESVTWADPEGKEPDIIQSFSMYDMTLGERQVAILKASEESGPYGGRRKPETITDLRERNDAIRKEYERYQRNRVPRAITLIARHFQLSTRQVGRILTEPK